MDGADDNAKPAEVSDNRRTTRSAGAATSSSKVSAKNASSIQPQKRPEIHIFSSKSRTVEDSDDEIIEVTSPKSRVKKRPLPDGDEVFEIEEARGKRTSLRPLYDSDEDEKTTKKKVSTAKTVKKNGKRAAEAVRGKRGGRAGGRGGKVPRAVKSKVIITDSSSAESELEVAASDPAEVLLAPQSRPKPKPAYKTAGSVAKTVEITTSPTAAAMSSQPPTDVSTESSLTTASETTAYPSAPSALPTPPQAPILPGMHISPSATSTYQVNPIPSAASMQVIGLGPPPTLSVASAAIAPSVALQGDFFEGGLLPVEEGPQAHTTWDPRLPYSQGSYTGHRDPRFDPAGHEAFRIHSGPPGEEGWDVAGRHNNYRNQDRRRGYEEMVWDGSRRDEYREVRWGGREEAGWGAAGQEEYREARQMGRNEGGWAVGGRYNTRHLPEARHAGWEAEEFARYGAAYSAADYGDPSVTCA